LKSKQKETEFGIGFVKQDKTVGNEYKFYWNIGYKERRERNSSGKNGKRALWKWLMFEGMQRV